MFRLTSRSLSRVDRSSKDKIKATNKQTTKKKKKNKLFLKIRRVNHNYAITGLDNENLPFQRYSKMFTRELQIFELFLGVRPSLETQELRGFPTFAEKLSWSGNGEQNNLLG